MAPIPPASVQGRVSMPCIRTAIPAWVRPLAALLLAVTFPALALARDIRTSDLVIGAGFRIEAAVTDLAAPTTVAFDAQGRMLIAESGYDGAGEPKVTRIEADGKRTVLARGDQLERPLTSVAVHDGTIYVVAADTVSTLSDQGQLTPIITDLPGLGDHQADQLAFIGDRLYLSIGTMTNSGVVGPDNAVFGWLKEPARRELHDVPCADVTLADVSFESDDPVGGAGGVTTTAYSAFGTAQHGGTVVPGDPKCNGAILSAKLDGTDLRVEAWGFRNPYGLEVGADGALYATMHGFDARGSRPIEDAWDCFYRVEPGAWYGWPDFACDVPVTDPRFKPAGGPQPKFVLATHPTDHPPAPIAKFDPHDAANGFAFAPGEPWGPPTDAFVALFGDFTPATGTVDAPRGVKIVRVDTTSGRVTDFLTNAVAGEASKHGLGGLEHPSDVTFGPDGAMYIADWGLARISTDGLKLDPGSGVIWRVTADEAAKGGGIAIGLAVDAALVLVLLAGAVILAWSRSGRIAGVRAGLVAGVLAGLAMGGFMMLVVSPILVLPWYAAPRVLATMVMGRAALADILSFDLVSFVVGVIVLVVLSAVLGVVLSLMLRRRDVRSIAAGLLAGLAAWGALQFFLLPLVFPLVSDKGFPPIWYAASFGLFGVVASILLLLPLPRRPSQPARLGPPSRAP
jgi:glucose/arabinose dehydrogenase